jgi:hypothetical protein
MSIKNIVQQENDLQEMSQQSLANYLNNPTGQYNPYLVAGELQRKEQYAQRQMVEAPKETVVDELVAQAMPMGGMPMGGMPMPRPQEAMMPDAITETGVANLPAPNIGQNYAEGGIIGYEDGGEVDYKGLGEDLAVEAGLMSIFGLPGMFMAPSELGDATIYDDEDFAEALANQDSDMTGAAAVGAGVVANEARKKAAKTKIKPIKPTKAGLVKAGGVAALEAGKKILNKLKPNKKTPPTSKTTTPPPAPKKGPLTRATVAGLKQIPKGVGPLTRGVKTAATRYPVESLLGLGGLGYGANAIFGESDKEEAARLAADDAKKAAADQAQLDLVENARLKNQSYLDAAQAKRDAAAKRRAYLALALGGAKTMAGQSQYALTNIGEGVGTGVAGLVELEEADAARQATIGIAEQKYMNDLYKETISQMDTFNDLKLKLRGGEDQTFTQVFLGRLDDKGIDPSDVTNPDYIKIENETIIDLYPGAAPRGSTMVAGQPFIGV